MFTATFSKHAQKWRHMKRICLVNLNRNLDEKLSDLKFRPCHVQLLSASYSKGPELFGAQLVIASTKRQVGFSWSDIKADMGFQPKFHSCKTFQMICVLNCSPTDLQYSGRRHVGRFLAAPNYLVEGHVGRHVIISGISSHGTSWSYTLSLGS